jgi:hypothetical protein
VGDAAEGRIYVARCDGPPAQEQVFEQHHDPDSERRENRDGQQRREYERRVHVELRRQDEIADPPVAADEFADDRADERQRKRDLQRIGDVRQRVHQPHLGEDPPLVAARDLREIQHVLLDLAQARERIHEHREDRQQEGEQDLRLDAEPEPDDEERRHGDFGMLLNAASTVSTAPLIEAK